MKNKLKNQRRWIKSVIDKYEAIEKLQPQLFRATVDEWPEWVCKLWHVLFRISHPGLNMKCVKNWTTKDLGRFLGRQSALEGVVWNEVPLSSRVTQEKEQWIALQAAKLNSNPKLARAFKKYAQKMRKWRPLFKKFIDETLVSARKLPYSESSAFLEAFGKAVVIKPDDLASEDKVGVGERIAWVMFLYWQQIAKFSSVGELHRFLSLAAKPMGIVISLKRIEKLCWRIGLKFRKPGRPKKGKIQTSLLAAS